MIGRDEIVADQATRSRVGLFACRNTMRGPAHATPQCSGRSPVVVIQQAAHTFAALNWASVCEIVPVRLNESVAEALMISFEMIMGQEGLNGSAQ